MTQGKVSRVMVRDIANYIVVGLLIVSAFYFGFVERPKEMALMISAFTIGGIFVNLDKFKWFRGAGFEAQLAETVEEAYATKKELEQLIANSEAKSEELVKKIEKAKGEAIAVGIALN